MSIRLCIRQLFRCTAAVVWLCAMASAVTVDSAAQSGEVLLEIEAPGDIGDSSFVATDSMLPDSLPPIEKMPEIVTFVEADYPPAIVKSGIEGAVLMDLLVSDSGTVDSVAIVRSLHPALDSSAMIAARKFRFTPAIADSQPVAVILQYEYRFSLNEVTQKTEQYVNFTGQITELGTRTPVVDAMVVINFIDTTADTALEVPFGIYLQKIGSFKGQFIEGGKLVSITDSLGRFQFFSLPACSIEISVPVPGYEEFREREQIFAGEAVDVAYRMRRVSYSEYEIVVYGKREEKEVSRRQLSLQEVRKIPGFGGDAVKVVQALPGVARATFGSFQMVIRGSQASSSKFFLDGVEIPLLFHYGLKSTYNSDALDKVDFYPGGWGTRYGGAVGGIIEITGRRPKTDRWHGYLDANFFDGSLFVEGPVTKKISVLAQGRRSFIGDLIGLAAKYSPTTLVMTTAPYYWDYIVRTDIDISKRQHAYFTVFGVQDGLKLVVSSIRGGNDAIDEAKNTARTEITFNMAMAGWQWEITDRLKNDFKYAFTKSNTAFSSFGIFKLKSATWSHYLRDQFTATLSQKLMMNLGVDMQLQPTDFFLQAPNNDYSFFEVNKKRWLFGVVGGYLNAEWRPVEKLQIMPGVRYDFYPELSYNGAQIPELWDYHFANQTRFAGEPAVRLTTRYELVPRHTAKLSAGSYSQSPQPDGQWLLDQVGNPKLSATRAGQYVAGWEWQLTDLIHSDLQVYYNRQWNLPRFASAVEKTLTGEKVLGNGMRRMWGMEILLRHDQGQRFFGWLAYSLSRSESWDFEEKQWVLTGKDQTHNLIAVGSWKLPRNWEAGFKLQFTTGDPETPVTGSYYQENFHAYISENGPTNSSRLDPTVQLDLRIDKKFVLRNWMLSAYVDFFNIGYFLYKSPQLVSYDPSEPFDYRTGKPNARPVNQYSLPSIGIKGEF
jgi:TonB family protein